MLQETGVNPNEAIFNEKAEQEFKMLPVLDENLIDRFYENHFCLLIGEVIQSLACEHARRRQKKAWLLDIIEYL